MMLLLAMFPIYLLGNAHCVAMCGPLVALLGRHPQRQWYLWGRLLSFTLFGTAAGALSESVQLLFRESGVSFIVCLGLGLGLVLFGLLSFFKQQIEMPQWLHIPFRFLERRFSTLMTKNQWHATFLFGVLTLALPCGQSFMILSTSALFATPLLGGLNAFLFALCTSPSLYLAMQAHHLFRSYKTKLQSWVCLWTIVVGLSGIWRAVIEWAAV